MQNRRLTFSYLFFYLLFSDDTWRIVTGFVCAVLLGPMITEGRDLSQSAEVVVWLMIMAIGWSISGWPAKKITAHLKRGVSKAAR